MTNKNPGSLSPEREQRISACIDVFVRAFFRNYFITFPLSYFLFELSKRLAGSNLLAAFLNSSDPAFFTATRTAAILNFISFEFKVGIIFVTAMVLAFLPFSFVVITRHLKYAAIFSRIGISNRLKEMPLLVSEKRIDKYRTRLTFYSRSIGIQTFKSNLENFEAAFGQSVESIVHGKNQSFICISLTKKKLETQVSYEDLLLEKDLPPESFYIGQTAEGPLTHKISAMPHMLIAGSTGSGKSVFFKQALMGLLESSPHISMALLDLKQGLEMQDFVKAPNVVIIKDIYNAVTTLKHIESEMKDRFYFMEQNGIKEIIPSVHKKDRIIIAVDEASVLFSVLSKNDRDYNPTQEARKLIDTLAKLARAAAINIILATQKLEKSVIPTTVSENIPARMAFKANSLQGSFMVIGSKDAWDLPEIKGRGIFVYGSKHTLIQAPYISDTEVIKRCEHIAAEFENHTRISYSNLNIGSTSNSNNQNKIFNFIKKEIK